MQDEGRNEEVNPYEDDLERPRSFAYGKHDLHLGPASEPEVARHNPEARAAAAERPKHRH